VRENKSITSANPVSTEPAAAHYNRFNRWSRQGLWLRMFEFLTGRSGIFDGAAIDHALQGTSLCGRRKGGTPS